MGFTSVRLNVGIIIIILADSAGLSKLGEDCIFRARIQYFGPEEKEWL